VFKQAALTLHTIAAQHPFFDGNKRTEFATAENVLRDAGYYFHADDDKVDNLMHIEHETSDSNSTPGKCHQYV
jgi:death-on-curing family protein